MPSPAHPSTRSTPIQTPQAHPLAATRVASSSWILSSSPRLTTHPRTVKPRPTRFRVPPHTTPTHLAIPPLSRISIPCGSPAVSPCPC
jgi:hypothetical protein